MTGRSSADDAFVVVKCRLVEPPSLVRAIFARMQVNRTIVSLGLAHNIHALVILYIPYFQIDAILGHGPRLADLTGAAHILLNRDAVQNLFAIDLHTQITVHGGYRVITRSVTRDIKLLVVTGLSRVAVECL